MADAGFKRFLIHGVGDGHVRVGQTGRREVDEFLVIFTARKRSVEDLGDVAVDRVFGDQAFVIDTRHGLGTAVDDRVPVVADDLVRLEDDRIFIFPAANVAVEGAFLDPVRFKERKLRADRRQVLLSEGGGSPEIPRPISRRRSSRRRESWAGS